MGSGFSKMKKQAKAMQDQYAKMREDMQNKMVTGTSGNGLVTITLSGDHKMKELKIKPECVDPEDVEGLEDLIRAAYEEAASKLESEEGDGDLANMMSSLPFSF
ncbi:MAG: YbaB/EbfC family nucleoid-associated protein [Simkaniaceae bacterium]|nr:YbaB/EbfC family nucleoid-associated protein [Candidatus Sacchlamyda saccharinae]